MGRVSLKLRLHIRMGLGWTSDHCGMQHLQGACGMQWTQWTCVSVAHLQNRVTCLMDTGPLVDVRVLTEGNMPGIMEGDKGTCIALLLLLPTPLLHILVCSRSQSLIPQKTFITSLIIGITTVCNEYYKTSPSRVNAIVCPLQDRIHSYGACPPVLCRV